jgi:hypothetical protein
MFRIGVLTTQASVSGSLRSGMATVHIAIILALPAAIGVRSEAAVLTVGNATNMDQTYDVSGKIDDAGMNPFAVTITIPAGKALNFGGPNGSGITKDKMVKETKVFRGGVQIASVIPVLDYSPVGAAQLATILAAADGVSDVFSFFDFGTPGYSQLIANVDFTFAGFEDSRVPILLLAGTSTRITDSTGQLFPQFQFTGSTVEVGTVQSPIPEPSTLLLVGIGVLAAIFCQRRGVV